MNTARPARSPLRHVLVIVLLAAVAIVLLRFVLPLALAAHHFSTNPDFHTFAQANPVTQLPASHWPDAQPLTTTGDWSTGPIDPFTLDPEDPEYEPFIITHTVTIKHGLTVLLEHTREAAAAIRRADGTQHAFSTRIVKTTTHPDFRVKTRTWLNHPDAMFIPEQFGRGSIRFQTLLLSGAGDAVHEVNHGWLQTPLPAAPATRSRSFMLFTGLAHPPGPLPREGLIYLVTQNMNTGARYRENGRGMSILHGMASTMPNTHRFSYDITTRTAEPEGGSTSHHFLNYEWNGKVW